MKRKILKIYILLVLFVFPWFLLPLVSDAVGWGRNWFLIVSALVGILVWLVDWFLGKRKNYRWSGVLGWMAGMVLVVLVSLFSLPKEGWVRMWINPFGAGSWLAILTWMFLLTQVVGEKERRKWLVSLSLGSAVLGLISLILFLLPESRFPLMLFSKERPWLVIGNNTFSSLGSLFMEAGLFFILAYYWFSGFRRKLGKGVSYGTEAAFFGASFLGVLLSIYLLFKYGMVQMGWGTAWVVAVESFKTRPFTGIGPGNFLEAFLRFRPNFYNLTGNWNRLFTRSQYGFFNIWTELGLLGMGLFLARAWRVFKDRKKSVYWWLAIFSIAMVFALPVSMDWIFLTGLFLVVFYKDKVVEGGLSGLKLMTGSRAQGEGKDVMPYVVAVLGALVLVIGGYFVGRYLYADVLYQRSLVELSTGKGVEAYSTQIKAIGMNPGLPGYRISYAQTNLGLAGGILEAGEELSEEDKERVSVLLQQAVREAKVAVNLQPRSSLTWGNLARVYTDVVGVVEEADQWAVSSYQQAVALDPANPVLRVGLGGLFFGAQQYERADRFFEEAVIAKSNYANGWYNWAYSAKKKEDLEMAVSRLQQAMALVPVDSQDYEKVLEELEEWRKELEVLKEQQGEQAVEGEIPREEGSLVPPEALPTVSEEEMIDMPPEEAAPPEPEVEISEEDLISEEEMPVEEETGEGEQPIPAE